jgi:hypothetical protein
MWTVVDDPRQEVRTRVDAIKAVVLLRQPESIARLWDIERAAYGAGFISASDESHLREAAATGLGDWFSCPPSGLIRRPGATRA